jgi:glycosyltransferase involved in cell wall biosynthesis
MLSKNFELIVIWDDSWKKENSLSIDYINSLNVDKVIFFQSLPSISELIKIKKEIIWVPMYDSIVDRKIIFWLALSIINIRIISFSSSLSLKLKRTGIDFCEIKYFLNPDKFKKIVDYSCKKVFFWERSALNFNEVKKIIGNQKIDQFILKMDPDPGYKGALPSQKDINRYNIKLIKGFLSRKKYLNILKDSNIFIAPREFEGIGMSFLEAMSMGMAVIGINNPTMNEYIKNGRRGYLFDLKKIKKIDISNFKNMGVNSRLYCQEGYSRWIISNSQVIDFIKNNGYYQIKNSKEVKILPIKLFRKIYFLVKSNIFNKLF